MSQMKTWRVKVNVGGNSVFTGFRHLGNLFQSTQLFKRELTILVVRGQALVWPPSELDQETDLLKNISPSKSVIFLEGLFPWSRLQCGYKDSHPVTKWERLGLSKQEAAWRLLATRQHACGYGQGLREAAKLYRYYVKIKDEKLPCAPLDIHPPSYDIICIVLEGSSLP